MDFQTLKKIGLNKIIAGIGILVVIVSVVVFPEQTQNIASPTSIPHDKNFITAMNNLSHQVPSDSVLVVSTNSPFVTYFTGHPTHVPYGASSKASLVDYMVKRYYNYLLVFEDKSQVEELKPLFSSQGVKSLGDSFEKITSYSTQSGKIDLFKLKGKVGTNDEMHLRDNTWKSYTVSESNVKDLGAPDISAVNSVQIRIADDGTDPVSVWIGSISLVNDHYGNETVIASFESGHGFKKMSSSGTQTNDSTDFARGKQPLKITTDGDGKPVFTRKSGILPGIDFTGKHLKLWFKISDISKLSEFRVTVTNDSFIDYRNYWIQIPKV